MLEKIRLENFKCFETLEIPFRKVNVLTGINGMGKSTIIQSLLALRQSFLETDFQKGLCLNGRYVRLGNGQDILYEKPSKDRIEIAIRENGTDWDCAFAYSPEEDVQPWETRPVHSPEGLSPFGNGFIYLSANRITPQELYEITNEQNLKNREFNGNGEYALQFLNEFGSGEIHNKKVLIPDKLGNTLANQVRMWKDEISPGVSPQIRVDKQLRKSEVRYEYIEGRNKTNSYKSVNVGFGITYVLPVVIALLSAKENDLIILENPEAHIHPRGQRKLGELIAAAGAGNAQILVETHSDHILNGIRIAVKNRILSAEDTNLLYFYKDDEDYKHKVKRPEIREDGRISEWPDGFLDEWDKALMELL